MVVRDMYIRTGYNQPFGFQAVQSPIGANRQQLYNVNFGSQLRSDTFVNNSVSRFISEDYIRYAIASNPRIRQICSSFNPTLNINMVELKAIMDGHCTDTQNIANNIAANLPAPYINGVDFKKLNDAAYLHDIGKVLIPQEVLDKPGKLDKNEFEIIKSHAELSYELLKNSGLDQDTLNLIKYHHQNLQGTGYPAVDSNFNASISLQVLALADKYSAMTEKRVYREAMTPQQALNIIKKEVEENKFNPIVYEALEKWVNSNEKVSNFQPQQFQSPQWYQPQQQFQPQQFQSPQWYQPQQQFQPQKFQSPQWYQPQQQFQPQQHLNTTY